MKKKNRSLLFRGAFSKTKREMLVSVLALFVMTILLALAMYLTEHMVNPEFSFWDALIWIVVKYVEDPAEVVTPPRTIVGMAFGTLVGFMSVAIVAIPAGLFGSGFIDAMRDRERENELAEIRIKMRKAFNRWFDPTFREFMNKQPEEIKKRFEGVRFVHSKQRVADLQSKRGMEIKDVLDVCRKYKTEFRLRNMANAKAEEARAMDCLCVEHFVQNRVYGCCIDRKSDVTIVCPTSNSEMGMGWFTYYLAKLGGFNYISKEEEADPDERDTFLNMTENPAYDGVEFTDDEIKKMSKKDPRKAILERKNQLRKSFIEDLNILCAKEHSWAVICIMHLTNSKNSSNFHFAHALKDGSSSTINEENMDLFMSFYEDFKTLMRKENLTVTDANSARFPLTKRNLGYRIRNKNCNSFMMRVESELINFGSGKLLYAYTIADLLSRKFDNARGINDEDLQDLKRGGFGYMEDENH